MTTGLRIEQLERGWGGHQVLDGVDLDVAPGEIVAVLGPSGCGKTTLLRIVAGLDAPDEGVVRFGDRDVTDLPPGARDVGMVFQHHALLPHLSVRDNIGFGLRARRRPAGELAASIGRAADLAGCAALLDRAPSDLSGGERQRVALARALARRPSLVLLDEPLSSLDVHDRARLRTELGSALRESGATALHVTHDQGEAFAIGDRVALLADGRIQQVGTADELYDRPATLAVASFVGSPAINVLPLARHGDGSWHAGPFPVDPLTDELSSGVAEPLVAAIRPMALVLTSAEGPRADASALDAVVAAVEVADEVAVVHLDARGTALRAAVDRRGRPSVGDQVRVTGPTDRFHLFDGRGVAVRHPS